MGGWVETGHEVPRDRMSHEGRDETQTGTATPADSWTSSARDTVDHTRVQTVENPV